jgi:ubiquinone/menaquinone biosynthesis C-methylase UbiE
MDGTFDTAMFDVVVCSETLKYVPDFAEVLDEIARVLDQAGDSTQQCQIPSVTPGPPSPSVSPS